MIVPAVCHLDREAIRLRIAAMKAAEGDGSEVPQAADGAEGSAPMLHTSTMDEEKERKRWSALCCAACICRVCTLPCSPQLTIPSEFGAVLVFCSSSRPACSAIMSNTSSQIAVARTGRHFGRQ